MTTKTKLTEELLWEFTVKELKDLARLNEYKGFSTKPKEELIKLILDNQKKSGPATTTKVTKKISAPAKKKSSDKKTNSPPLVSNKKKPAAKPKKKPEIISKHLLMWNLMQYMRARVRNNLVLMRKEQGLSAFPAKRLDEIIESQESKIKKGATKMYNAYEKEGDLGELVKPQNDWLDEYLDIEYDFLNGGLPYAEQVMPSASKTKQTVKFSPDQLIHLKPKKTSSKNEKPKKKPSAKTIKTLVTEFAKLQYSKAPKKGDRDEASDIEIIVRSSLANGADIMNYKLVVNKQITNVLKKSQSPLAGAPPGYKVVCEGNKCKLVKLSPAKQKSPPKAVPTIKASSPDTFDSSQVRMSGSDMTTAEIKLKSGPSKRLYYEVLKKKEKISPEKKLYFISVLDGKIYKDAAARKHLGFPVDANVVINQAGILHSDTPGLLFVQSTSPQRVILQGQRYILI